MGDTTLDRFSAGVMSVEGKRVIVGDSAGGSNQLTIYTGTNTVEGDSNLTFDGDVLTVTGQINFPDGSLGSAEAFGEIVDFGNGSSLTAGNIYSLNSTNTWSAAHADNVGTYSTGILAVALGSSASDGMLIKGYARFTSNSNYTALSTTGVPIYLKASLSPPGGFTQTAPSNPGEMVRVIGYVVSPGGDTMYFNPDPTWVEIA